MSDAFFEHPILNSPYAYPARHWELDPSGQPTQKIIEHRRPADFVTPIPKPKRQHGQARQTDLALGDDAGLSTDGQRYAQAAIIRRVREQVDRWRQLPETQWHVTPETARLLRHWRHYQFNNLRPFFCQIEAAETAIW
ncbi:MAG: restriction endonuclease, partial [Gammaproteobacteria bacterium]